MYSPYVVKNKNFHLLNELPVMLMDINTKTLKHAAVTLCIQ